MRVGKNALYPADFLYGSPSKPLRGREIHRVEQGVRGYSVVPLLFFSQSTVFSKRGYG